MFLLCHRWLTTINLSHRFPNFVSSATALCGTTGISLLISGFLERLDIEPGSSAGDVFGNMSTHLGNGYELLRQLSRESVYVADLKLSLRVQLMAKEFKADSASGNAYISDVIRQIDVHVHATWGWLVLCQEIWVVVQVTWTCEYEL